jgi:sigma-B regulation protein RsbU (phosphoserine phosphatase)
VIRASRFPVLAAAPPTAVEAVLASCPLLECPEEQVLLSHGALNSSLYFVLSGRLRVHPGGLEWPEHVPIEPGDCTGEFSLIDGGPVSASVVAEKGTRLLVVDAPRFWNELLPLPGVAAGFLRLLTARARQTLAVLVARMNDQLALEQLEKELRLAREIQASMVPVNHPLFPDRLDVQGFAAMEPARRVGGDFLDTFFVGESRLFFAVGDVAGKGVPAALFMARTMGLLRLEAGRGVSLPRMLYRVNHLLCQGNASSLFVTLAAASLDVPTGELSYVNGGHAAPVRLSADGDASFLSRPAGILLGAFEERNFPAERVRLRPGDRIILYTDGVTEAHDREGHMFGAERLLETLASLSRLETQPLVESLLQRVLEFGGGQPPADDVAILSVAWNGPTAHGSAAA